MNVVDTPIDKVVPYARNPRKNAAAVAKVAGSLKEFGFRQPIVCDEQMVVIAGHTRLLAAQSLGLKTVPVHVAKGLTKAQVAAYRIADNRTGQEAEWDNDLLAVELSALADEKFDLSLTGFDADELTALMEPPPAILDGVDLDDAPEPPAKPITKPGDLITLGRHVLVCGDSTDTHAWESLMAGRGGADMLWTDPPYGVAFSTDHLREWDGGKKRDRDAVHIENDALSPVALADFLRGVLSLATVNVKDGAPCYVAGPALAGPAWAFTTTLFDLGVFRQMLVWVKDSFVLGRSDYHGRFEAIYYGWKPGAAHKWYGDRKQDTVLEVPRPRANKEHPTMKPVALVQTCIENSSDVGAVVVDPFGGSGTTLMACEATQRAARLIELDPKYCDVIVTRWETATGQKAERPRG